MTSMIRIGDTVVSETNSRTLGRVIRHCPGIGLWYIRPDGSPKELIVEDGDLILICGPGMCGKRAERFDRNGAPLCLDHADVDSYTIRPDPDALGTCVCGFNLDRAPGRDMTIGDTVAEYRHCPECHSDRAYIAVDEISGKPIEEYAHGLPIGVRYTSLLTAMCEVSSAYPNQELRRGPAVLAKTIVSPKGAIVWRYLPPTKEV